MTSLIVGAPTRHKIWRVHQIISDPYHYQKVDAMALLIGVIQTPNIANPCALDLHCPKRGALMDAMLLACSSFRLNCSFHWFDTSEFGDTLENGTATGMMGAIQRGDFDTSLPVFTPTYRRYRAVGFSSVFSINEVVLMTRTPPTCHGHLNWNVIMVFDWQIWVLLIFFLVLLSSLIFYNMQLTSPKIRSWGQTLSSIYSICIRLGTSQIGKNYLFCVYNRLMVGFWLLAVLVLQGAYTGTLFSESVFHQHYMPFTDLETFVQCLENYKCKIITPWLTISELQELSNFGDLGERFEKTKISNPFLLAPVQDIPMKILEEQDKFLVNVGPRKTRMQWIHGNKECVYYVIKLPFRQYSAFPVQKNSTHLQKLNKIAQIFQEYGLEKGMDREYFSDSLSRCQKKWSKRRSENDDRVQQSLISISGAFIYYVIGISVGMIGLILENVVHRTFDKRRAGIYFMERMF